MKDNNTKTITRELNILTIGFLTAIMAISREQGITVATIFIFTTCSIGLVIGVLIGLLRSLVTKELVLSMTYLRYIKRDSRKIKLILFVATAIFFGINRGFPQVNLSFLPLVLLSFISLLIVKELVLEYRIRKGLFGTNRIEAQALIEFIIKHSDDIDFTDSNGNLRRTLVPRIEPTPTEQTLPAFGEEAPA
ncbi:MAG: hypothetical protein Q3M24_03255 [Candidatus Electrothrix aestuarii]|uniref:Uncharacterized protein n=1 Tax=Candidatus Electrothrix aestuarii TaxID=3062594 RepID=A0AAU8LX47_9BACT|nr:hypothetical protein [Candidatus Electrothrix aestuarii]